MSDVAGAIEGGSDPTLALNDHGISDAEERHTLRGTIAEMQRLHAEGSDHIWAYYSRNLVRPVALSNTQGGRGDRQSAVAELQQDREHAADRAGAAEQERLRHLDRRAVRHVIKMWPGCSSRAAPTCT